ncbi:MAG: hypothetical protein KJ607_14705 [Bacteroidetes bacterium]|nr:hypothetical protein [Bacteroidota bacterium]
MLCRNKVRNIRFRKFLTDDERKAFVFEKDIVFSKEYTAEYERPCRLSRISYTLSGIDSNGFNHFRIDSSKFSPYPFPAESIYKYDATGRLAFIEMYGQGTLSGKQYLYGIDNRIEKIIYYSTTTAEQMDLVSRTDYFMYNENGFVRSVISRDTLQNITGEIHYIYDEYFRIAGIKKNASGDTLPFDPVVYQGDVSPEWLSINDIPVHEFVRNILKRKMTGIVLIQVDKELFWHFVIH